MSFTAGAGLLLAALAARPAQDPPADPVATAAAEEAAAAPSQAVVPEGGEERRHTPTQVVLSVGPQQEWVSGSRQPRGAIGRVAVEEATSRIVTLRLTGDVSDSALVGEVGAKVLTPRYPVRGFGTLGVGFGWSEGGGGLTVGAASVGAGVEAAWGPIVVEAQVVGRVLARAAEGDDPGARTRWQAVGLVGVGHRFWLGR